MHLLTSAITIQVSGGLGTFGPGQWLMNDLNAFEIGVAAPRGAVKVSYFENRKEWTGSAQHPSLIVRQGAIGDLLMLTPVLAEWKRQTGRPAVLCCWAAHFPLFDGNTDIHDLVSYPLPSSDLTKYREIISLENTMELDHTRHATDVFLAAVGLDPSLAAAAKMDYRPRYFVRQEEKDATKKHRFATRPNLVVQQKASVANRNYPLDQWLEAIVKLEQRGWGVLLMGRKGQLPPFPGRFQSPFIRDLSVLDLPFRESAAVLAQSDAFVGVDSAFVHLADALEIPAVGLYGPFDWLTRTSHAKKTTAIMGTGSCARCSWHMHGGKEFPPNKPCTKINQCVVLASIAPERIVSKVSLLKP